MTGARSNAGRAIGCPNGHGAMVKTQEVKRIVFRGVELNINYDVYKCQQCGVEAGTQKEAAELQKKIADAYRSKKNLLTGEEIRNCRQLSGLTQEQLADQMGAGVASIKRWEKGAIQTPAMDKLLRGSLGCQLRPEIPLTGNRDFSLSRIKLVLREFEKHLKRTLLVEGDRGLYTAKYPFYADMIAYRERGESMTGATYARLPHGPQLNNYKELIDEILQADEREAEPLTMEEIEIIKRIADKFPGQRDAYYASHRERIVTDKKNGMIIQYTEADQLTEI